MAGFQLRALFSSECYAPEGTDAKKIIAKINGDFKGALTKWAGKIKEWIFVYSEHARLPPMVVSLIEDLKTSHPSLAIDTWNRERLWKIVRGLPLDSRISLLGVVPVVF